MKLSSGYDMATAIRNTAVAPTHHDIKAGRGWLERRDEKVIWVHVIAIAYIKTGNHQKKL